MDISHYAKGVSILGEYEFMKPACDFNLANVSEQTHLCSSDPEESLWSVP